MFPWLQTSKLDKAGDGTAGGAGGVMTVPDPGAPVFIGEDITPPAPEKKEDPTAARLTAMEAELKNLRERNNELSESERYWANQAQTMKRAPAAEEEVIQAAPEPEIESTPEQDLDNISRLGLKEVLKKQGFVSRAEMNRLLAETDQRAEARVNEARSDAGFDAQLATEFPEIKADHDRIASGQRPQTPLYTRTAEIYRQAVQEDPRLKGSKSTLLLAARTAKAQLAVESQPGDKKVAPSNDEGENRQQRRRDRIESQRSDRAPAGGEESDETPSLTAQQREVMSRLKVSEPDFIKNSGVSRSGR